MRKTYENNIITNQNLEKWMINILLYVRIFFCDTPLYLRTLLYLATNCELSEKINMKIYIIEKIEKNNSKKTEVNFL